MHNVIHRKNLQIRSIGFEPNSIDAQTDYIDTFSSVLNYAGDHTRKKIQINKHVNKFYIVSNNCVF